jgi:alpha-glucosidase (family GH31 glycosyl hydrolase)
MRSIRHLWLVILIASFAASMSVSAVLGTQGAAGVYRATFEMDGQYLTVEVLDDDLAHFQLSLTSGGDEAIWTTPMVAKTDYSGPTQIAFPSENVIETPDMRLEIDEVTLCTTVTDLTRSPELTLTTFCPLAEDGEIDGLSFTPEWVTDLYGLGEQFPRQGGANGNWFGGRRFVMNIYGNEMARYNGGSVGNAQFPILYALGAQIENYALFLDDIYQHYWDFGTDPYRIATSNDSTRWYVMTGADLQDLRRDYMELVGHPPVPPKQMLGLWVSEYGYESWDELLSVLASLRAEDFPVDGFVLDLQWFGGVGEESQMGSLAWDLENFPDPAAFIAELREQYGLGLMTIEESYVSETAAGYTEADANGVLLRECAETTCSPISLDSWWGEGAMVDWTNADAASWWHDHRRQHLIDAGIVGHWTDLGEPEDFDESAWYYGFPDLDRHDHRDVHNIYNLLWAQSIWEGYQRNDVERRPFILSRSGTSGIQRYGAAMWSGDIAANMLSLEAQMNVQTHMSLSGVDYFGADVGGFQRQAFDPVLGMETMYTIWLANAALLDVPLRPHANNLQNAYETAPSLIGDIDSNRANVRLRYELSPYLYTLAHRAYRYGDPVFAPLVYYFQTDPNVRALGSQKMIGPDLMMTAITGYDTETVSVYLPAGDWFNYYTGDYIESRGESFDVPTVIDGLLRAPLFVRAGAIIPTLPIDEETLNLLGQRVDGSSSSDLVVKLYFSEAGGSFALIEDDGETMAYQDGAVSETLIMHSIEGSSWHARIAAPVGEYTRMLDHRDIRMLFFPPDVYDTRVSHGS